MKKIIYIGNNLHTGNPTTMQGLSRLLAQKDYNVRIYGSHKSKFIRLLEMLVGLFKNLNADFVLIDTYSTSNFYFALIISQCCRVFKIEYIPILHGGNLKHRINKNPNLSNLIFNHSYKNISPSHYLVEVFKTHKYDVVFIANPIKLSEYNFNHRLKCKANILWVRAFQDIYNPQMAIEVLNLLKNKGVDAKLCMVGPDKDRTLLKVKELICKYNLENRVELTGFLTKENWYKKAKDFDIFINTTTVDNIPVSVIEAMALGLPVVSTNVGGIPFLIKDSDNGLLVNNNNVIEMTTKIKYLIENDKVASKISANARQFVKQFDSDVVIKKWVQLLKDV